MFKLALFDGKHNRLVLDGVQMCVVGDKRGHQVEDFHDTFGCWSIEVVLFDFDNTYGDFFFQVVSAIANCTNELEKTFVWWWRLSWHKVWWLVNAGEVTVLRLGCFDKHDGTLFVGLEDAMFEDVLFINDGGKRLTRETQVAAVGVVAHHTDVDELQDVGVVPVHGYLV